MMARPIRVEFEGAVYHVTARGNERQRIYRDDQDRMLFLTTLEQSIQEHGLRLHGYCLMPNHFHLLVETPRANLSRAIGRMQTTYTIRFNRRHRRSGHLFQGRFKAHLVEADGYAMELLRYVHLNPVRPRNKNIPVPPERQNALQEFPWSSHLPYLGKVESPAWLCRDWLAFFGSRRSLAQAEYGRFVSDAFGKTLESPWAGLRFGLVLGGDVLLERVRNILKPNPGQEEVRWVMLTENGEKRIELATALAQEQPQRPWQIFVRVCLGGERRIDVARSYGYKDGSAVTQIIKRLESHILNEPAYAKLLATIQHDFETTMSSVKS